MWESCSSCCSEGGWFAALSVAVTLRVPISNPLLTINPRETTKTSALIIDAPVSVISLNVFS